MYAPAVVQRGSTWRKVALAAWRAPESPTAYGTIDVDVDPALAYLRELRRSRRSSVTLTHLVGKALALGLREVPEVNAMVSGSRIVRRKTIDIFFHVAHGGMGTSQRALDSDDDPVHFEERADTMGPIARSSDLSGAKIERVDEKDLTLLAEELDERVRAIREGTDPQTTSNDRALATVPSTLVRFAVRAGSFLSYDLGLDLSKLGVPYDAFGSAMISNVGFFGLPNALAPLSQVSRVPFFLTMGSIRKAPRVVGREILIRRQVTLGISFDHRIMDAYHAGRIAKRFLAIMANPKDALRA